MKAILMSIKPKWVGKILNGKKTIEIRKKFPKDYVGWVYIYCTKDKKYANLINRGGFLTGMVVARFWCDKVEQVFWRNPRDNEHIPYLKSCDLLKCACLCQDEFEEYVGNSESYAIHITSLEIFDKPKELKSFFVHSHTVSGIGFIGEEKQFDILKPLNRAPQSWCHVEI